MTRYEYDAPLLGECFMEARLCPLTVPNEQICRDYVIRVDPPVPVFGYVQPNQMGLVNHFVVRGDPHEFLLIQTNSTVEMLRDNPFHDLNLLAADWPMLSAPDLHEEFAEFLVPTPHVPFSTAFSTVWKGPPPVDSVLHYGQALSEAIYTQFEYVPGATDLSTPLADFVAQKRGVCQDYAHLMLAAARANGVPARYVSGYVYSGNSEGADGETHGGGATHAWVELYLPDARVWKGFDPTNNVLIADKHIKVAVGRDYSDVPPTKGILRAARGSPMPSAKRLDVEVRVEKIG